MSALPKGLGLGCWQLGGAGSSSPTEEQAHEIVRGAYGLGIRHFDTAQSYGKGLSEQFLGGILPELPEAFAATKIHFAESERETLERVAESRTRLRREIIDLVYLHWPHTGKDLRPVLAGLEEARRRGWIREIGVSNFSAEQMAAGSEVARIDAHQIGYSLLWRYPENEVIPYCREHGIAFVAYTPLAQGLLTGKMARKPEFPPDDPRPRTLYYDAEVYPHVYTAVQGMMEAARAHGTDLLHAAIGWVLRRPGVSASIAGVKSLEQLRGTFTPNFVAGGDASWSSQAPLDEELTSLSDDAMKHIPNIGNIFKHYP